MRVKGAVSHFTQKLSHALCLCKHIVNCAKSVCAVRSIIFIGEFFLNIDNGINAEAAETAIQPPVDIFVNFFPDFRVFPVKIRLFFMEKMQVLFVRMTGKRLPYGTAEIAAPVAGKLSFFFVFYIKEVAVFSVRICTGLFKPFMFVRAVIDNKIQKNIHVSFSGFCKKPVHIIQSAECRVNVVII